MGKDLNGKNLGKGFSQRKDKRYEARATINGIKIDMYNMSLSELKKDFEIAKAKLLRDEKSVRPNLTVGEWYSEWFEKCKSPQLKTEISRKTYDRKIRNTYIALLREKRVEDLTQINIQDAANELLEEKGYSERMVREATGVLRDCLDIAVVNHIIQANPCQSILIKESNECQKERRVLSHWEQNLFLEEIKTNYYNEAYRLLLLTGMRIGEFAGLQWNDIDWERKVIRIYRTMSTGYFDGKKVEMLTTPKTSNSYREIPFFGETASLLKEWRKKQDSYKLKLGDRWRCKPEYGDLVFTSTMGSPVTRYVIAHDLKKVEQNMNLKEQTRALVEGRKPVVIEHMHPHCFRHTFCTRLFEKGMSPVVVQAIMGHANYSTTISYTHVLENTMQKEAEKVGDFFDYATNQ